MTLIKKIHSFCQSFKHVDWNPPIVFTARTFYPINAQFFSQSFNLHCCFALTKFTFILDCFSQCLSFLKNLTALKVVVSFREKLFFKDANLNPGVCFLFDHRQIEIFAAHTWATTILSARQKNLSPGLQAHVILYYLVHAFS